MSDDTILAGIAALSERYSSMRCRAITIGPAHREGFTNQSLPEPSAPLRVYDNELLAYFKEHGVETTADNINESCERLIEQGKLKLINAAHICAHQYGNLYEIKHKLMPLPETTQCVLKLIAHIETRAKQDAKPAVFVDWDIFHALEKMGENKTIQQIHNILMSLVQGGRLRFSGDLSWFNPNGDGYTYEIIAGVEM